MDSVTNGRLLYLAECESTPTLDEDYKLQDRGLVKVKRCYNIFDLIFGRRFVYARFRVKETKITELGTELLENMSFRELLAAYEESEYHLSLFFNLGHATNFLKYARRAMSKLSIGELVEFLATDLGWVRELAKEIFDSKEKYNGEQNRYFE